MPHQKIELYENIDWSLLWRNCRRQKSWQSKKAADWDKKAAGFASRVRESGYTEQFIRHLSLDRQTSVLDVGCGPGTLALPIADQAGTVTALDYSPGMLACLEALAGERKIINIRTLQCAWEDDWQQRQVGMHDIAIASRSMNIDDLAAGIAKLDAHAARQVFIADRISPSPFDPDAFQAIGREFKSGPDYIYTVNTLYSMGIHPRIDHIELPDTVTHPDMKAALASAAWMFKELSPAEERRLEQYLSSRIIRQGPEGIVIKRRFPQRWALISWKKQS